MDAYLYLYTIKCAIRISSLKCKWNVPVNTNPLLMISVQSVVKYVRIKESVRSVRLGDWQASSVAGIFSMGGGGLSQKLTIIMYLFVTTIV